MTLCTSSVRCLAALLLLLTAGCAETTPALPEDLPPGALIRELQASEDGSPVVLVRVHSGPRDHRFEPAEIHLPAESVLRFVMTGPVPDAVVFDTATVPEAARAFLRARSAARGPLLLGPGQAYDVDFDGAPEGRYPFESLLRGATGMRGTVTVGDADAANGGTPQEAS